MLEKLSEKFPDDAPFIRNLINSQQRVDSLRVYADWLEESGDMVRAEIVRIHIQMANLVQESPQYRDRVEARNQYLEELTKSFPHARQWLALIGFGPIEVCFSAMKGNQPCPRRWENMPPVEGDGSKRLCLYCNRLVHYCDSIEEAAQYVENGELVTVDPKVPRRRHDLGQFRFGV